MTGTPVKLIPLPEPPRPKKKAPNPLAGIAGKFAPNPIRRFKVGAGLSREEVVQKLKELDSWGHDHFFYDKEFGVATVFTMPEQPPKGGNDGEARRTREE